MNDADERLTEMLVEDGIPPERAERYVEAIEALIDAKIQDAAPEFLHTRDV